MSGPGPLRAASRDPRWVQIALVALALGFLTLVLILPLLVIVRQAFAQGAAVAWAAIRHPEARAALELTLITSAIVVPLNTLFGLAAAWLLTRHRIRGKALLTTLIDLPFAVSPVIAGMLFVLLFGATGLFGPWLRAHHVHIIFATPGIVLATLFVTFPFVARELIAYMQAQGHDDEEAALTLGASPAQMFWRVTLPNIKWGLLYGMILCNARAMGEFGAVSVVSGHISGATNTLPLQVEILYNEYQFAASFAVAGILLGLGLLTVVAKRLIEWRAAGALRGRAG
jgi:sulfate transport system permease protein